MHTVAKSYFEAFAVDDPERRETAGIWRFERYTGKSKVIGVNDSEVVNDIYTVYDEGGTPDIGIENILAKIEGAFNDTRNTLLDRQTVLQNEIPLTKEQWAGIAKFVAAQVLRTPRFFQMMRDYLDAERLPYESDTPQRVMLILIDRWIIRLVRMRGLLVYTETDLPLLTSDNPAVMWKKNGKGFICGIDQYDAELVVSCPLTPELLYVAYQTPESLKAVHAERHDIPREERKSEMFRSSLIYGSIPEWEVKRLNHLCLLNAHNNVYANYCDKTLFRLLENRFWGQKALYDGG
jgi:hypothetical protein